MVRFAIAFSMAVLLSAGADGGFGGGPAQAEDGFRCESGRLVLAGDHIMEVQDKCGEPDFVSQRTIKRKVKQRVVRWVQGFAEEVEEQREVEVLVDEWTYDMGPRRFTRYVLFEDDRVLSVLTGNYGRRRR